MTKAALLPVLFVMTLGLAGCASAPVHYYTLMAPTAPVNPPSGSAPDLIEVLPVGIPEALNRQALVVRRGEAGIAILERERWAGPLDEEVRRALSAQLAARLGAQDVTGLTRVPGQSVLRVKVEIRRLDAWPGRQVDLEADWSVGFAKEPGQRTVCRSRLHRPASAGDSEALVAACQQVMGMLAQRIAEAARTHDAASGGGCP